MKLRLLVFSFVLSTGTFASPALANPAPAHASEPAPVAAPADAGGDVSALHAELRKMFVLDGTLESMEQLIPVLSANLRANLPADALPEGFFEEFARRLNRETILAEIVPLYARHLAVEDVRELNRFYAGAAYRRAKAAALRLQPETVRIMSALGARIGEQVERDLRAAAPSR